MRRGRGRGRARGIRPSTSRPKPSRKTEETTITRKARGRGRGRRRGLRRKADVISQPEERITSNVKPVTTALPVEIEPLNDTPGELEVPSEAPTLSTDRPEQISDTIEIAKPDPHEQISDTIEIAEPHTQPQSAKSDIIEIEQYINPPSMKSESVEQSLSVNDDSQTEEIEIEVDLNYGSLFDPVRGPRKKIHGEHKSVIRDICEVLDPKTGEYVFGRVMQKTREGYHVELILPTSNQNLKSRPCWFFPEWNVHPPGTFLEKSDAISVAASESGSSEHTSYSANGFPPPRMQSQPLLNRIPPRGLYLGFNPYSGWHEYICGRCGDVFPIERCFKKRRKVLCSSCRFPNLYMDIPCGLQVYQRPAMGWPTETCTICNRVYPTRFARRNPPKCVTCRCEFEEKAFADSHCRNCGIVHFGGCIGGVGGPQYVEKLFKMKAGEEIWFN